MVYKTEYEKIEDEKNLERELKRSLIFAWISCIIVVLWGTYVILINYGILSWM